jgi:hypothetical protein
MLSHNYREAETGMTIPKQPENGKRVGITTPSLKERAKIVREILTRSPRSRLSVSTTDNGNYEHLKIRGVRIDIFAGDIREIEARTGMHLHGMTYWNEPDFHERHPHLPKYMQDYTAGNHVEIRFVGERPSQHPTEKKQP